MAACASPIHDPRGVQSLDHIIEGDLTDMLSFFDTSGAGVPCVPMSQGVDGLLLDERQQVSSSSGSDGKQEQSVPSSPIDTQVSYTKAGKLGFAVAHGQPERPLATPGALLVANGTVLCAVPRQNITNQAYDTAVQSALTGKDIKTSVSHSTIEKQRRDRINSLIDELRDLVPPASAVKGPDGSDLKRPKHVVLSDTISLLRTLREKVQRDEEELRQLKQQLANSAGNPVPVPTDGTDLGTAAAAQEAGAAHGSSAQSLLQCNINGSTPHVPAAAAAAMELPKPPLNLPAAVGVLVEEGPGNFLVKVNCKDRRGLLSDITSAIGGLPLQITRAAITTSDGGAVFDVFEIVAEEGADLEGVNALDVQHQVHQALYKWRMQSNATTDSEADRNSKRQRSA